MNFCPDPDPQAPLRELLAEAARLGYRLVGPGDATIRGIQEEVMPWSIHNFGNNARCPVEIAALGLGEECGEVQRALIKRYEGIRGSYDEWTDELKKELGDVFIKLCDLAGRAGLSLEECITVRWAEVGQRDFQADHIGHGMPGSETGRHAAPPATPGTAGRHTRGGRHHTGTGDVA